MKNTNMMLSKYKIMSMLFFLSILIIISYIVTMELEELFRGAEKLYSTLFQFSIGYCINFIFFYVNVFVPQKSKERKAFFVLEHDITRLLHRIQEMSSTFDAFILLTPSKVIFDKEDIGYYKIIHPYDNSTHYSFLNIDTFLKTEYIYINEIITDIINNQYFILLNENIIEKIHDLQYSEFLYFLEQFSKEPDCDLHLTGFCTNRFRKGLDISYSEFMIIYFNLSYLGFLLPKKMIYIELNDIEKTEYLQRIAEKRKIHPLQSNFASFSVENDRIY